MKDKINYIELGPIKEVYLDYCTNDKDIDMIVIKFENTTKVLKLTYTTSCCEISYFNFGRQSVVNQDIIQTDNDYIKLFIGRIINAIEYVRDEDNDDISNDGIVHLYDIEFTDFETVTLNLTCISNGYYDSELVTTIE